MTSLNLHDPLLLDISIDEQSINFIYVVTVRRMSLNVISRGDFTPLHTHNLPQHKTACSMAAEAVSRACTLLHPTL